MKAVIKIRLILILFFWSIAITLILFLSNKNIDRSKIYLKEGTVLSAKCLNERTHDGIELQIRYLDGNDHREFISLPLGISCYDLIGKNILNKTVKIYSYENYHLEIEINNQVIGDIDARIKDINDSSLEVGFILFITTLASLLQIVRIFKNRRKNN